MYDILNLGNLLSKLIVFIANLSHQQEGNINLYSTETLVMSLK